MLAPIELRDAALRFDPDFVPAVERAALFVALRDGITWETHVIRLFGRDIPSPRLSCWIGDPGTGYVYSGTQFEPHEWSPALLDLRDRVAAATGARFNSVLANRYRDGRDSMGFHADDEPELGREPVIASLSVGATRRFVLRHRTRKREHFALDLNDGSLLVMAGATQRHWNHALPKTARPVGERINLTFRWITPREPQPKLRRRQESL
ncbi:MAG TPA: alpha-ketoglutarate-dependent dioxygenase AlkB [Candidatus Saccharimonadia bacterium]|nr:alpha-ketoglutarate-dependent dioxygenase AlkB [Candidatus Saccharimonadia bacterium]